MNRHRATLPDGKIAKRDSKGRIYSHLVAVQPSFEHALREAFAPGAFEQDRKNFAYYAAVANGSHPHAQLAWVKDQIPGYAALVAKHGDTYAYAKARQTERGAKVRADEAAGAYDRWSVAGWCGRPDLAGRLHQAEAAKPRNAEVKTILAELL